MPGTKLTDADRQLVTEAAGIIRKFHSPGRHNTGAAVRTGSGNVYRSVSMKADTGFVDLHAEPLAVAQAILNGETEFGAIAAVQLVDGDPDDTRVVSACGACREFLRAFAPELSIVVNEGADLRKYSLSQLLPAR